MYDYTAEVLKFVDGDTLHVQKDHGTDEFGNFSIRLNGLNCPEMSTPEGKTAAEFTKQWCFAHGEVRSHVDLWGNTFLTLHVRIKTVKDHREKYGRYLAEVFDLGAVSSLNEDLLTAGQAVPYSP